MNLAKPVVLLLAMGLVFDFTDRRIMFGDGRHEARLLALGSQPYEDDLVA